MSLIRTYATKSVFSPHNMVYRHISKLHSENHDLGIIFFCKKTIKILTTLSQFYTEIVDYHWVHIRALNSWSTVNQYCAIAIDKINKMTESGSPRLGLNEIVFCWISSIIVAL